MFRPGCDHFRAQQINPPPSFAICLPARSLGRQNPAPRCRGDANPMSNVHRMLQDRSPGTAGSVSLPEHPCPGDPLQPRHRQDAGAGRIGSK